MKRWDLDVTAYQHLKILVHGLSRKISLRILSWKVTGITSEKKHNYMTLHFCTYIKNCVQIEMSVYLASEQPIQS